MPITVDKKLFQHMLLQEQSVYQRMSDADLDRALKEIGEEARQIADKHLTLDMARGKPSREQTALSKPMLDLWSHLPI